MITARFENEETFNTVSDVVFQWDYGQVLQILGLNLPSAIEIDFSTDPKGDATALSVVGSTMDSVTTVGIPDEMFSLKKNRNYWVYAFVYTVDSSSGETVHRIDIPVYTRPARQDYSGSSTEDIFGGVVETIQKATDETAQAVYQVEGYINTAQTILDAIEAACGNFHSVWIEKDEETGVTTLTITDDEGNVQTATIDDGKSAYQIAQEHGYTGSEEEWLESLKGAKGDPGGSVNYRIDEANKTIYMYTTTD